MLPGDSEALSSTCCPRTSHPLAQRGPLRTAYLSCTCPRRPCVHQPPHFRGCRATERQPEHRSPSDPSVRERRHMPHPYGWQLRGLRSCSNSNPRILLLEAQNSEEEDDAWQPGLWPDKDHIGSSFLWMKEQTVAGEICGGGGRGRKMPEYPEQLPAGQWLCFNHLLGTSAS